MAFRLDVLYDGLPFRYTPVVPCALSGGSPQSFHQSFAAAPAASLAPAAAGRRRTRYLIVMEATTTGYSAYSPDLPGCVAAGADREEAERNMREAVAMHLEALREAGEDVPEPSTTATYVDAP